MKYTVKEYWKQCVKDHIECSFDMENINIKDCVINQVVEKLLNDDYLWSYIDECIDYFLRKEINK